MEYEEYMTTLTEQIHDKRITVAYHSAVIVSARLPAENKVQALHKGLHLARKLDLAEI